MNRKQTFALERVLQGVYKKNENFGGNTCDNQRVRFAGNWKEI